MMDEFDLVLLDGIRRGYFDQDRLKREAEKLDKVFVAGDGENVLKASWRIYHDSFDDNEAEVVKSIISSFKKHVRLVTPLNLSGTVKILKDLGRPDEAREALTYYMDQRAGEERQFFDLDHYAFGADISDPDVRAAFDAKYRSFKDERSPAQALLRIAKSQGWSRDDIRVLSKMSADDLYQLFKNHKGDDLGRVVRTCLQFEQINGTSDEERSISAKAKEALLRIGKESRINRRRVKKFGMQVEEEAQRAMEAAAEQVPPRVEQPKVA